MSDDPSSLEMDEMGFLVIKGITQNKTRTENTDPF